MACFLWVVALSLPKVTKIEFLPYYINTLSSRQVMRKKKNRNQGIKMIKYQILQSNIITIE